MSDSRGYKALRRKGSDRSQRQNHGPRKWNETHITAGKKSEGIVLQTCSRFSCRLLDELGSKDFLIDCLHSCKGEMFRWYEKINSSVEHITTATVDDWAHAFVEVCDSQWSESESTKSYRAYVQTTKNWKFWRQSPKSTTSCIFVSPFSFSLTQKVLVALARLDWNEVRMATVWKRGALFKLTTSVIEILRLAF